MPLVVLTAFFALIFGPTLLGGRLVLIGDPLKQFYPIRTVAWQMIRDGHLPLWTPHILSGYPLSSMVMLGLGYPLTWSYLFLPGQWAEQIYVLAPYLLAPLFTYAFLREWDRSQAAALLGALTFGYGGFLFSPIGLTGIHANSALWLPLLLLAVARARRRPFFESLLLATAAYTMSVLAGSGQIFLYAGALALAYAMFLAIFPSLRDRDMKPRRWQPLAVVAVAIVLAVGLTAFQTFQTWTAMSLSIRHAYPQARVAEGSFAPGLAWRSLLQPLGNFWDSSTFIPLLAALLALAGLLSRRAHAWFWSFIAVISWLLILGKHSALFPLYVRVPFVQLFRYPSRHSMEWTFAIAVLASYGWDVIESAIGRGSAEGVEPGGRRRTLMKIASAGLFVVVAAFTAFFWRQHTIHAGLDQIADPGIAITGLDATYVAWKAAFTLCMAIALAVLWRLRDSALRRTLLATVAALCCFVEPYLWLVRPAITPWSVPREMFGTFGAATHALLNQHPGLVRTLSVPHPYSEDSVPVRDVDPVNWTALAGMEDANGYESLILSRYVRAFRGGLDTEPFITADPSLLGPGSHLLDLLNVGYVVAFAPFSATRPLSIEKDGVTFTSEDFGADVKSDHPFSLTASGNEVDSVALVTTLGQAGFVEQGAHVARISLHTAGGRVVERDLLAGIHTSEMTYDRADVKAVVRHRRAPIFDSGSGEPEHTFESHRFFARVDLGERLRVTRIDFLKTAPEAGVGLWKVSLHDAGSGKWVPLPQLSPDRWQTVYDRNGVIVAKNLRALPRAWLVSKVGTLDESEILRMIRGESAIPFDPRTEAFIETSADPRTSADFEAFATAAVDARLSASDRVRIVRHDPNRIVFDTTSSQQAMLVVSEIDYPGWIARLDGADVPIHRTDFLLRGVFVPRGRHRVEMIYRAPGARTGTAVSVGTFAILIAVAGWLRFRRLEVRS